MFTATLLEPARVWFRKGALDRKLAHGADPSATPELTRRARQLTSRRRRSGLAEGIHNVIDAAEEPQHGNSAVAPLQRPQILRGRDLMELLAADLTGDDELTPRGIVLVEALLTDGASPLYAPGSDRELHHALVHARAALHLS